MHYGNDFVRAFRSRSPVTAPTLTCVIGVWGAVVVAGMILLINYSSAPGNSIRISCTWPEGTEITRDSNRNTLVIFLHPHCPCSRASVNELARILANSPEAVDCSAVFYCPVDKPAAWAKSSLWKAAERVTGRPPVVDRGGQESRRFGALTSGHVVLFGATGECLFSGGVTNGRGHEGDSRCSYALRNVLHGRSDVPGEYPVFGCPLTAGLPATCEKG